MDLKSFFKITLNKLSFPVVGTFMIVLLNMGGRTIECWYEKNIYDNFLISNSSMCSGPTIFDVVFQYLTIIVIPFMILYTISCFISYKNK